MQIRLGLSYQGERVCVAPRCSSWSSVCAPPWLGVQQQQRECRRNRRCMSPMSLSICIWGLLLRGRVAVAVAVSGVISSYWGREGERKCCELVLLGLDHGGLERLLGEAAFRAAYHFVWAIGETWPCVVWESLINDHHSLLFKLDFLRSINGTFWQLLIRADSVINSLLPPAFAPSPRRPSSMQQLSAAGLVSGHWAALPVSLFVPINRSVLISNHTHDTHTTAASPRSLPRPPHRSRWSCAPAATPC